MPSHVSDSELSLNDNFDLQWLKGAHIAGSHTSKWAASLGINSSTDCQPEPEKKEE